MHNEKHFPRRHSLVLQCYYNYTLYPRPLRYPPTATTMSRNIPTTDSNSHFQSIFDQALKAYKDKTGKDLASDPLLAELTHARHSPEAILAVLRRQIPGFDQPGEISSRWTKWLDAAVNVLLAFSTTIGGGVGLVRLSKFDVIIQVRRSDIHLQKYDPASVIFTGFGVLLSVSDFLSSLCVDYYDTHVSQAVQAVRATKGVLVDLFERLENVFRRLETYTDVPPAAAMQDMILKIMVEVLSVLAIVTKEIKRGTAGE
jgi:uncharacterized UPF0146 family protein